MGLWHKIARLVRQCRDRGRQVNDADDFRRCRFETMETRRMLSGEPLRLGAVYIEEDIGSDVHGDSFEITFLGGADGTQLNRVVISGDQAEPGFGADDVFFDTLPGGKGADNASPFQVISLQTRNPQATVTANVEDGSSILTLDLSGFEAGDKLVFSIDVDEVEIFDPLETDLTEINDGFDPITSGVEFQSSKFTAYFSAPHFHDVHGDAEFQNRYDDEFAGSGLNLSADDAGGKRDRSDGAIMQLQQSPLPIAVSGTVFLDNNLDLQQTAGEPGLADVSLALWHKQGDGYAFTGFTTQTDSQGNYEFSAGLNLLPGTYEVRETQPGGLFSVGAVPGNIEGVATGATVSGNRDVLTEIPIPLGGQVSRDNDFAEAQAARVSGHVYHDRSNDGVRDPNEEGIAGVPVQIVPIDTLLPQNPVTVLTDPSGFYEVDGLVPGRYEIVETVQPVAYFDGLDTPGAVNGVPLGSVVNPGDRLTGIVLAGAQAGVEYNFGEISPSSIAGRVHLDTNGNCVLDAGEQALSGVTLQLLNDRGNVIATTLTDENGRYRFNGLTPGVYSVRELQPSGVFHGDQHAGTNGGDDSQPDLITGIAVGAGQDLVDYDFCELPPGSIAGQVRVDLNGDCRLDANETPLAGVTVQLLDAQGATLATALTDAQGHYQFSNLAPGVYGVRELQPADYFHGDQHAGSHGGNDALTDAISSITLTAGQNLVDYDFCEFPPASVSGYVFQDGDSLVTPDGQVPSNLAELRDGVLTPDDLRLPGVRLELRDGFTGEPIDASEALPGSYPAGPLQVTTDINGFYEFRNIPGGRSYAIFQIHPDGFADSIDTVGTTSGFAFNPQIDQGVMTIQPLAGQPPGDAIIRIGVGHGQSSEYNNFSEVRIETQLVPPVTPPPVFPPPPTPPSTPEIIRVVVLPATSTPPPTYLVWTAPHLSIFEEAAGGSIGFSWHLSVINGGLPRELASRSESDESEWNPATYLDKIQWNPERLREGQWIIGATVPGVPATGSRTVFFGIRGGIPVVGDFDGDGQSEIGVFYRGEWFIDLNGNGQWDDQDLWAKLGDELDRPVVGDWDGDGKDDIGIHGPEWFGDQRQIVHEPGLPDSSNNPGDNPPGSPKNMPPNAEEATDGKRLLRFHANGPRRADVIDHVFRYGSESDAPVAGDWNGDGIRTVGIFNKGVWRIDSDGDGLVEPHDQEIRFGREGDLPVIGDWDGNGIEEVGVYRGGQWILDSNGNRQLDARDRVFEMGGAADRPVVGDWNGDGADEPAIFRETPPASGDSPTVY